MNKLFKSTKGFVLSVILIVLSIFGIKDLLQTGYYTSHDGEGHVIRMVEFAQSFADGQIPVRWSKRLYNGYGYPFYNFNYPSTYYLGLPAMWLGFSATDSIKIVTITSFIVSSLLMFYYLRKKVDDWPAFLGAFFYIFNPYRFSNIYVRGSVAETIAFIFPPLLLIAAENIADKKSKSILWSSLILAFVSISHNISALLLFAMFFIYLGFLSLKNKNFQPLWKGFLSFCLGLLIAGFFIAPALLEKKYTFLDATIAKDYPDHFISLVQLVKSGWNFGASVAGPNDGMSFNLGYVQLSLAIIALIVFLTKLKKQKIKIKNQTLFFFAFFMLLLCVFMMLPSSKFLWDNLPLLPFVQFPWRFTTLVVPILAIMSAVGFDWLSSKKNYLSKFTIVIILVVLTLWQSKDEWHINQVLFPANLDGLEALQGSTTWADEQATQWFYPKPTSIPLSKVEFPAGLAELDIKSWQTGKHSYSILTDQETLVMENTMYYPGWKVFVDDKEVAVDYQNPEYPGRLLYKISTGSHVITSRFTETPMRLTLDLLSLISFIVVVGLLIKPVKKKK